MARRNWLKSAPLRVVLTVVAVALVVYAVGPSDVARVLGGLSPLALPVIFSAVLLQRIVEALLMGVLLDRIGHPVPILRVFFANALSAFYALILPSDFVASLAKWAELTAATGSRVIALQAIVYNRVVIMLPLVVAGLLGACGQSSSEVSVAALVLAALALLVLKGVMVSPALGRQAEAVVLRGAGLVSRAVRARLEKTTIAFHRFHGLRLVDHVLIYLVSCANLAANFLVFLLASRVLGIRLELEVLMWVMCCVFLLRQLPITIANLGIREGFLLFVLGLYGVDPATAIALGVLLFGGHVFAALFGLAYQMALLLDLVCWPRAVPSASAPE